MSTNTTNERRPGLLGLRKRLAESHSDNCNLKNPFNTDELGCQHSLLERTRIFNDLHPKARLIYNQLITEAAERRDKIMIAFHEFLNNIAPSANVSTVGLVPSIILEFLYKYRVEELDRHFGKQNVVLFQAYSADSTETTILYRGELNGNKCNVLINRSKLKTLLRYLDKPSGANGDVNQTLILLYPRAFNKRLIIPDAVVVVKD
ncbi:uncharacterized protein BBOV_IV002035 [Babesia bovis T2Bo]|uniref:uncharacterized protein n=1 Tax=Babesia bovis T2Bo TaxID=484906 RepID=UPI001D50CE1B|nr:uncharacterized protein BBOV_IV002035 [Babesia bovis T2Bo]KAG6439887.1 hypothetical protein BBOV_IV002035 [Babesia bovis T2Bo]